jgi:ATP-dependent DNA ligase
VENSGSATPIKLANSSFISNMGTNSVARICPAFPATIFSKLKHLATPTCPFLNLPETRRSRFEEELNAEKMKKSVWLSPEAVAQIEFLEWTEGDRLRHSKFVGLREDKNPRSAVKEQASEP